MFKYISWILARLFPVDCEDRNAQPRELWLKERLATIPAGARILDAGAGELSKKKYCEHLDYVSQDFGKYEGKGDSKGLQTGSWDQSKLDIVCDIANIPEPSESFDAILCTEVFEHLPDPLLALREFSRLLRPGGVLLLTAPFGSSVHFAPYFFCTGFSEYWYKQHLAESEFVLEECVPNGNFSSLVSQEVGRIPDIIHRYCGEDGGSMRLSVGDRVGLHLTQHLLFKMMQQDKKSHEFVCFGYHVAARKV